MELTLVILPKLALLELVAVISAIHEADSPKQYIQELNQQLNHGDGQHV